MIDLLSITEKDLITLHNTGIPIVLTSSVHDINIPIISTYHLPKPFELIDLETILIKLTSPVSKNLTFLFVYDMILK